MSIFTVEGLIRRLVKLKACGPIPSDVKRGEILGILCASGQSRKTLVDILTTALFPVPEFAETSPLAILGSLGDVRQNMGIVLPDSPLDLNLTGRENLEFHVRLYGLSKRVCERRVTELIEFFNLSEDADTVVGAYAPVTVRRLDIARAHLAYPRLLLLAEPTRGLDGHDAQEIRDLLKRLNREWMITIVFTTHDISDTDGICDRAAVVDGGEIVALDAPETFIAIMDADGESRLEFDDVL